MGMQLALPELNGPATLVLDREDRLSDDEYFEFCQANPNVRIERTAEGEIVIVPPAGLESDYQSVEVIGELRQWAKRTRHGKAFGSSAEFMLPDGSALSPDASWVSNERPAALPRKDLRQFPHVVPEFVVEVMSPSDKLRAAQRKMQNWMANGVELAWLVHGDAKCVYVYRQGREPERLAGIETIAGEGPVKGFVLDLSEIWAGL